MATKSSGSQKTLSAVEQRKRKKLISFAAIYNNDTRFPAHYDLERAFRKSIAAIQQQATRYRTFRNLHPEWHLPFLVGREIGRGGLLEVPESVMKQLDQFRYETEKFVQDAKAAGGFLVTSAQFGAPLNPWVWKAFQQYSKATGFPLAVLPIKYGALQTWHQEETGEMRLASSFPDELKGHVILEDAFLCRGELQLNTVRMRPTLVRFLTDDICELGEERSQIMAAPVVELERRPQARRRIAKVIMTTGAVTYPNYRRDKLGQQDRTGEIAEHNHVFAAVVVELKGDVFHFRQLVSGKRGTFYDIDPQRGGATLYTPEGVEHRPNDVAAAYLGDWHTGKTDPVVRTGTFGDGGMIQRLKPKDVVLGDVFDGDSCSWYQTKQSLRRAWMSDKTRRWDNLKDEIDAAVAEVKWIYKQATAFVPHAKIHVLAANHPEFVREYIESERFMRDDHNKVIGMRLYLKSIEEMDKRKPEKYMAGPVDSLILWFREQCPEVHMLERQDMLLLPRGVKHSVLCSLHGDQGIRGGDTRSTRAFKKWNRRVILGHNHSGQILGPVWRVGTATPLMQFYIQNPKTDWSQTHCVIFASGQRQLINFVRGEWHGQKVVRKRTRKS